MKTFHWCSYGFVFNVLLKENSFEREFSSDLRKFQKPFENIQSYRFQVTLIWSGSFKISWTISSLQTNEEGLWSVRLIFSSQFLRITSLTLVRCTTAHAAGREWFRGNHNSIYQLTAGRRPSTMSKRILKFHKFRGQPKENEWKASWKRSESQQQSLY